MRWPKLRELKEAVRALLSPAFTTRYPAVPHVPQPRFRGKPVADDEKCTGCMACAQVCPTRAIEFTDDPVTQTRQIKRRYDACIFCGQCEALCSTREGVKLTAEFDLATFDRHASYTEQKKGVLFCPDCGRVITTRHHLRWLAERLGELGAANLPLQQELAATLGMTGAPVADPSPLIPARADAFRLLCPRCRHRIALFDEYGKES